MTSSSFWSRIAVLDGVPGEAGVAALIDSLADSPIEEIRDFSHDLARAVHALDTPTHLGQTVRDVSEPVDMPPLPMSSDVFLDARLAVVAAGHDVWRRVLADPGAMSGTWHIADAEDLLTVADRAYERATGEGLADEPPVSMETGSNVAAWGERASPSGRWWTWLMVGAGWDVGVDDRPGYTFTLAGLERALDGDPKWQDWWANAKPDQLELFPFLTPDPEPTKIRVGRRVVQVEHSFGGAELDATAKDDIPDLAVAHLRTMLEAVRARLRLPELPSLPEPQPLPEGLPDVEERSPDPTPEEVTRLFTQVAGMDAGTAREMVRSMFGGDIPGKGSR